MSNIVQIKRGRTVPNQGGLMPYELGYIVKKYEVGETIVENGPEGGYLYVGDLKEAQTKEGKRTLVYEPVKIKAGYADEAGYTDMAGYTDWAGYADRAETADKASDLDTDDIGAKENIFLKIYPVGSIYMSTSDKVNPRDLFGGTWEKIEDRFLLAASASHAAGTTGGESEHVLATNEMPRHAHGEELRVIGHEGWPEYTSNGFGIMFDVNGTGGKVKYSNDDNKTYNSATVSARANTASVGGNQAHNNMPPYLVVHMWTRIA